MRQQRRRTFHEIKGVKVHQKHERIDQKNSHLHTKHNLVIEDTCMIHIIQGRVLLLKKNNNKKYQECQDKRCEKMTEGCRVGCKEPFNDNIMNGSFL